MTPFSLGAIFMNPKQKKIRHVMKLLMFFCVAYCCSSCEGNYLYIYEMSDYYVPYFTRWFLDMKISKKESYGTCCPRVCLKKLQLILL